MAARGAIGARLAQLSEGDLCTYWKAVARAEATSTEKLVSYEQPHVASAVRVQSAELIDTGHTLALRFEMADGSEQVLLIPVATAADLIHSIGQVFAMQNAGACEPGGGDVPS